jgi:alpha-D-ribose 1-methylphosphonate 5-triphosphate synthase subunit PhnH
MAIIMKELHTFDETLDSQKLFRIILEAIANPTRKLSISEFIPKLFGNEPAMLAIAMTLLDNEVSFRVCENFGLSENISLLTHSVEVELESADFIFVTDTSMVKNILEKSKCGTLCDPHSSATIIVKNNEKADMPVSFCGAGIKDTVNVIVSNTVCKAIAARDSQNYEYPQGVDFIFVSDSGEIFCIPRLTLRRYE